MREYESVARWLDQVASEGIRSAATERGYLHFLKRFCQYSSKTPDVLIQERRLHLKSDDIVLQRQHEEMLVGFRTYLETQGLARSSAVTAHDVIKSFYKHNYVPLQLKSPKTWGVRQTKVPTSEEVYLMVQATEESDREGIRDKAVILCLYQCGMSLDTFLDQFTIAAIREDLETGTVPLHIHARRIKVQKEYDTFLGKSGVLALLDHLRNLGGNGRIFPYADRTIQNIVKNTSIQAGLDPHVTPHGLRKAFSTNLKMAGCPDPQIDYWMGHELPYGGAYFVPPVHKQRQLYAQFEHAITPQKPQSLDDRIAELTKTHDIDDIKRILDAQGDI